MRGPALFVLLAASGCTSAERPASAASADTAPPAGAPPAPPPDSLVLTLADGGTVWYTLARDARAQDGTPCVERTLEIRRGSERVAVPLLYTRDVPSAPNDTTLEARLYLDCTPRDRYRIDLRTGQPTPIR